MNAILEDTVQAALSPVAIYYCLAAVGLNIQFGYTGLINFGQAGFVAVGAYGVAFSVVHLGISLWLGLLVGIAASIVLAVILGLPTLRLRADYLAIVTIASAEILRLTLGSVSLSKYFGGQTGLSAFSDSYDNLNPFSSSVGFGWFTFRPDTAWSMLVGWSLVLIFCALTYLLMRSPWGRILKAIREDEDAVRSLGKNVYAYKMQGLALGGLIGSFGGFVYALNAGTTVPSTFSTDLTFLSFTMLILGGAARVLSPVFGAVVFWGLLSLVGGILDDWTSGDHPLIPTWLMNNDQAGIFNFILVGIVLMLLMIFRPQGVFGDRRELALNAH